MSTLRSHIVSTGTLPHPLRSYDNDRTNKSNGTESKVAPWGLQLVPNIVMVGHVSCCNLPAYLMQETDNDAILMRKIAGGDEDSLGELYDRFSGVVLAIAIDVLGDRQEAEDLVHDVFIEVWNRADSFDAERGSAQTWISVITRSRCIDRTRLVRWRKRKTSEPVSEHAFPAEESHTRPHRRADDYKIRRRIDELPDEQREIVILSYFGGFSSSEIAERLEIPTGTVKSRMRLAMAKFRDAFDVEDDSKNKR